MIYKDLCLLLIGCCKGGVGICCIRLRLLNTYLEYVRMTDRALGIDECQIEVRTVWMGDEHSGKLL